MRLSLLALLPLAVISLSACGEKRSATEAPPPHEVTAAAIGRYCGMALDEHAGPKGQVFVKGAKEPFWFSSVHDAVAFTLLPEEPKDIAAIYVNDMARAKNWEQPEPGTWIEARQALFVIDSRRKGGMGSDEAIPFGDEGVAKEFVSQHGGRVVRFSEIPRGYILGEAEPAPSPRQTSERPSEADHGHGGHDGGHHQ